MLSPRRLRRHDCFLGLIFWPVLLVGTTLIGQPALAQDASTALEGVVEDVTGARVAGAEVSVINPSNGFRRDATTDGTGHFSFGMLAPGDYEVRTAAEGMKAEVQSGVELLVGGNKTLQFRLVPVGKTEDVTVTAQVETVETKSSEVSDVVVQRAIEELPLNGRRYTDLALLTPGVTQDPRGLTSNSNGDLSFGGIRGYNNNFQVDGADDNNSFFAQARGRYRAPYQFSNEVIKEFRVASNSYSAELGRSGGAVFNVATKSGTNDWHGSLFYYLRDRDFDAQQAFTTSKPDDRQQQFGGSLGGPVVKDRIFFFAGFDQHILTVPSVVQFANGSSTIVPQPTDYEATDQQLVMNAANQLNSMGGYYPTRMSGNAGFAKLDWNVSSKQLVFARLSTSRLRGTNNVFFDPASPITGYAESGNGTEDVATESLAASWTSSWTDSLATSFRAQFSRDVQQSYANSAEPWTAIYDLVEGFGRSDMLPRNTREHKLNVAETLAYSTPRVLWKFGGDFLQNWIYNYYPWEFGGRYYFYDVKVNPWTFAPMKYGMAISPLRAYAHDVPRYYDQSFGTAVSHPNSRSYAAFIQSQIRATSKLTLHAGIRYDLQTFEPGRLVTNPLYTPSGKVPTDANNVSPRLGFAYSFGNDRPYVVRGGGGLFFTQVPSIYAAQVATDNGIGQSEIALDMMVPSNAALFPKYPAALVNCAPGALTCTPPPQLAGLLTSQVSAFAPNFQTPYTEQASLTVEHEFTRKVTASASYLYVHGVHLIRSLDVNLPPPTITEYPVFNDDGSQFLNQFYTVASFGTWQTTRSATCPYPPCINDVQRPISQLGTINSFESESDSVYNAMSIRVKRQANHGIFFQLGYTLAKAIDDGQDALLVGRAGNVQNSYATSLERGLSVTDQRHRLIASAVWEPTTFHFDRNWMSALLNHWKFSAIETAGSGRPLNATMAGDANRDDNTYNDRLPGYRRDAFVGPDYMTTDLRVSRSIMCGERARLQLLAESFNLMNRTNARVQISDDGFYNAAGQFVAYSTAVKGKVYPGQFLTNSRFLIPTNAYAPRQVQFSVRLSF